MNLEIDMCDLLDEIDSEKIGMNPDLFIFDYAESDFDDVIIERGEDYYKNGKVLSVIKDNSSDSFKALVEGSYGKTYDVFINYDLDCECTYVDYKCSCPCEFPCKHEYAVLLAIKDGNYEVVDLKEKIAKKIYNFYDVLRMIPAQEIKEYLLSKEGKESVRFDKDIFEKQFIKYTPIQSYEYYYNNLYNDVVLDGENNDRLEKYFDLIVDYFSCQMFEEVFKIIKAIVEVYHDNNLLFSKIFITDVFPKIGMYMRVVYRNCDEELRNNIRMWRNQIKNNNFYDNIFVQDIIEFLN